MIRVLSALILLLGAHISYAQQVGYAQIIMADSVVIFLSPGFNLTDSTCAAHKRFVRIDENGKFNSLFVDVDLNNEPVGVGTYIHGKRHGRFETYHANGKLASKGSYRDGKPIGTWLFFRENGLPERTLNYDDGEVRIMRLIDEDGDLIVDEGNGTFRGTLYDPHDRGLYTLVNVKGDVLNGRPQGKWRALNPNGNQEYKGEYGFFIPTYLETVERMTVLRCDQIDAYEVPIGQYDFDWNRFTVSLREKIKTIIGHDFRIGEARQYPMGISNLTIMFSTDNEGRPKDFVQNTPWGLQFYVAITTTIKEQTRFQPNTKLYFHLKLSMRDGPRYSTTFEFSDSPRPKF